MLGRHLCTVCGDGVQRSRLSQYVCFSSHTCNPSHAIAVSFALNHLHMGAESLGRATLRLSEVSSQPERYSEPYKLPLHPASTGRALEFQVFMSTQGKLAELTGPSGSISVLAATWNVGNALPPPPEQLKQLWLRGSGGRGEHHLVAVRYDKWDANYNV